VDSLGRSQEGGETKARFFETACDRIRHSGRRGLEASPRTIPRRYPWRRRCSPGPSPRNPSTPSWRGWRLPEPPCAGPWPAWRGGWLAGPRRRGCLPLPRCTLAPALRWIQGRACHPRRRPRRPRAVSIPRAFLILASVPLPRAGSSSATCGRATTPGRSSASRAGSCSTWPPWTRGWRRCPGWRRRSSRGACRGRRPGCCAGRPRARTRAPGSRWPRRCSPGSASRSTRRRSLPRRCGAGRRRARPRRPARPPHPLHDAGGGRGRPPGPAGVGGGPGGARGASGGGGGASAEACGAGPRPGRPSRRGPGGHVRPRPSDVDPAREGPSAPGAPGLRPGRLALRGARVQLHRRAARPPRALPLGGRAPLELHLEMPLATWHAGDRRSDPPQ